MQYVIYLKNKKEQEHVAVIENEWNEAVDDKSRCTITTVDESEGLSTLRQRVYILNRCRFLTCKSRWPLPSPATGAGASAPPRCSRSGCSPSCTPCRGRRGSGAARWGRREALGVRTPSSALAAPSGCRCWNKEQQRGPVESARVKHITGLLSPLEWNTSRACWVRSSETHHGPVESARVKHITDLLSPLEWNTSRACWVHSSETHHGPVESAWVKHITGLLSPLEWNTARACWVRLSETHHGPVESARVKHITDLLSPLEWNTSRACWVRSSETHHGPVESARVKHIVLVMHF